MDHQICGLIPHGWVEYKAGQSKREYRNDKLQTDRSDAKFSPNLLNQFVTVFLRLPSTECKNRSHEICWNNFVFYHIQALILVIIKDAPVKKKQIVNSL